MGIRIAGFFLFPWRNASAGNNVLEDTDSAVQTFLVGNRNRASYKVTDACRWLLPNNQAFVTTATQRKFYAHSIVPVAFVPYRAHRYRQNKTIILLLIHSNISSVHVHEL